MKSLLSVCLLLIVSQSFGKELPKINEVVKHAKVNSPSLHELDLNTLPINIAVIENTEVIFTCSVEDPDVPHSIQWTEFAHFPNGAPISDNEFVGNHPEKERYTIIHDTPGQYDLKIFPVLLSDGGTYLCRDAQANPILKQQHSASLTVVGAEPNCTTTIRPSGVVLDLSYQTNDCILPYKGGIIPNMTWSGIGPFTQLQVATETSVWAGMQFNVTRAMDTRAHQCTTFFTGYFLPVPRDTAENVPIYTQVHQTRQMFVNWGPTNMAATPMKPQYEAGDVLTCTADAFPAATFLWQNMRTNEITAGATVRIDETWRGFNQTMRCEARNSIEGTTYSGNIFIPVDVAPVTTPPTTTPSTTTTQPPAVSPCTDLSGPWISTSPTAASLCIRLDLTQNGALTGLLKNATDTYWVDIVGRAQANKFDQVGFNGIWPADIGVSSFIGECHRCFGEEQLLVNVVSRSKGSPCGVGGPIRYTTQYLFRRSQALQCPNLPAF